MEDLIFDLTNHRKLWNWLSENPTKQKSDWIGWTRNGGKVSAKNLCFACAYFKPLPVDCTCCPLIWGNDIYCEDDESLFIKWQEATSIIEKSRLAKLIVELPVREGVLTI